MENPRDEKDFVYSCPICGYLYDPAKGDPERGVHAGTPFAALPPDWVCPVCGARQELFVQLGTENEPQPEVVLPTRDRTYRNQDIIVYWYPEECSHAGKCWQTLPQVFDVNKRPWVDLNGSTAEEIIRTIDLCPSRSLQYSLPPGSRVDPALGQGPGSKDYKIESNKAGRIRVINDGPLLVEGPNRIIGPKGELIREGDRFVLCRCGKTKNPPFCDGRHIPERWDDEQE